MPLKIISLKEAFTALRKFNRLKSLAADSNESISLETKSFIIWWVTNPQDITPLERVAQPRPNNSPVEL